MHLAAGGAPVATKHRAIDLVNKVKSLPVYIYIYNTRNNDYHRHAHNLEPYNSKPSAAGCIVYNKLPNNIKQIGNNNQFIKKLKGLLTKGKHNRSLKVGVGSLWSTPYTYIHTFIHLFIHSLYLLRDVIIQ
jgi:hypothetical protein